jgi:hypothetical protein
MRCHMRTLPHNGLSASILYKSLCTLCNHDMVAYWTDQLGNEQGLNHDYAAR